MACVGCGHAAALCVDAVPHCTPCFIGALCVTPDVTFPYYDASVRGNVRPAGAAGAVGLENMPAAADLAAELLALEAMDARARDDVVVAVHTAVLGILGARQYAPAAWNDFVADMRQQVRETRALRVRFLAPSRAVSVDFVALTLAAMYAAWIGGQARRARHHMQLIDLLVTSALGAARATAIEERLLVPLGAWAPTDDGARIVAAAAAVEGEITRARLERALQ